MDSTVFTVDVGERCVRVSGEIDSFTAPEMIEAVLRSALVELDLSEVTFMDSAGLHALMKLRAERGSLRIVAISPRVKRLLEITSMSEHLLDGTHTNGEDAVDGTTT